MGSLPKRPPPTKPIEEKPLTTETAVPPETPPQELPKETPPQELPAPEDKSGADTLAHELGIAAIAGALDRGVHRAIQRVHNLFIAALPPSARSSGHFAPAEDHLLREKPEADVPDGAYRLMGSDWIVVFQEGRVAEFYLADRIDTSDAVEIPNG